MLLEKVPNTNQGADDQCQQIVSAELELEHFFIFHTLSSGQQKFKVLQRDQGEYRTAQDGAGHMG